MFCFHYFIFFVFLNCQILQLNAMDEEHNDIFDELWQKSEKYGTKSGKSVETLRTNLNDDFISQKIGKIKKEIVVKDEPNDYEEFDQFSNERKQKIALNKTVKEENVEERVKSEYMEFDLISEKEEFGNGEDGVEHSTDSYSIFDNSNLKESSSKSQKGVWKIYSEVEKQEIIAEFDKIKNKFKTRAEGMSYHVKNVDKKIAQKLGVSRATIYNWKKQFGISSINKNYSEVEKQEIIAEFDKIKNKFKTRAEGMSYHVKNVDKKIAQKLGVSRHTIYRWKTQLGISKKQNRHIDADNVKREIIMKYEKLKNKFVSPKAMRKINEKIEQKLGLPVIKIYNWKNALGISKELKMTREEEENEKWKIIKKFNKMKDEYVQKNDHYLSGKEIEEKIAKKLGFSHQTICKWKRKRGIYQIKNYTDAEKVELLKNFNIIKKENPQLRNDEIAQMLNISIRILYSWKRKSKDSKPDVRKRYSDVEKQEKIAEFDKLKKEFKTRAKGMSYDMKKIDEKIAQKLGVSRTTFYNWKNEYGILKKQKRHTEAEKAEFVKQFYKIEEKNPKMNKEEIAQRLNIPLPTINLWKRQFLNKVDNGEPIDNVQRHGGSERSTSSANSLNDIPWKWNDFRRKRNERIGKILF